MLIRNTVNLPSSSRIWIYQSKTEIPATQVRDIQARLEDFARRWVSHSRALRAAAEVLHNRFIILTADESAAGASGCSIDSSVRFLQQLEQEFNLDLFDRMTFTFEKDGKIQAAGRDEFAAMYARGEIDDDTVVFDNLVKTIGDLQVNWRKRLGDSWHRRMV